MIGDGAALQLLRRDHAPAVLEFEQANRAFFAKSISDRGDAYFAHFDQQLDELLADQAAGRGAFYVLLAADGQVLGRFNLGLGQAGAAVLGYRVAERICGRGVATAAVRELCDLAAVRHGVHTLRAAAADDNVASQRVLLKAGFVRVGAARPDEVGGKRGSRYERELAPPP